MEFMILWKKYGEPFTAISILLCLIISSSLLVQDHKLKREISVNCGWGEDDYKCWCKKSESIAMENEAKSQGLVGFGELQVNLSEVENVPILQ